MADSPGRDLFISYTAVNHPWAEWIAVQLEAAGYTTVLQAWDFRPGSDFSTRCSRPPPRRAGGHRQLCGGPRLTWAGLSPPQAIMPAALTTDTPTTAARVLQEKP